MTLIEVFQTLTVPNEASRCFNAASFPNYPSFKIAVDTDGNPVLLLPITFHNLRRPFKNFKLKYLQLEQNIECQVMENGERNLAQFMVITFTGNDKNLREYFLRISETLISTLDDQFAEKDVLHSLHCFVEIFRSLVDLPTKAIYGLWTELFVIENSAKPAILLEYWHNMPDERFDFNSGIERLEVKSNPRFERIHYFASEQLNPPTETHLLIASIFVKEASHGWSIQDLVDSIKRKIGFDVYLMEKLLTIVAKTLGSSLEESILLKFDYSMSKESIRFYRCSDISKIEKIHIPDHVSHVTYKTDLSNVPSVKLTQLTDKGDLFNALY